MAQVVDLHLLIILDHAHTYPHGPWVWRQQLDEAAAPRTSSGASRAGGLPNACSAKSMTARSVAELDKKSRGGRSSIEHEQRLCFDYEKMLIHTVF